MDYFHLKMMGKNMLHLSIKFKQANRQNDPITRSNWHPKILEYMLVRFICISNKLIGSHPDGIHRNDFISLKLTFSNKLEIRNRNLFKM